MRATEFLRRLQDRETFQKSVTIDGDLDLRRVSCMNLPSRLEVRGNLQLDEASDVPDDLEVSGNLDSHGCSRLPKILMVGGFMHVSCCFSLSRWADTSYIRGSLMIHGCPELTSLGGNLEVAHDLSVFACPRLANLSDHPRVQRQLYLKNCARLTTLDTALSAGIQDLHVESCGITLLPDALEVARNLFLIDCPMKYLPSRLRVGQHVLIKDCKGVKHLPESAEVKGAVYLRGSNKRIEIPNKFKYKVTACSLEQRN